MKSLEFLEFFCEKNRNFHDFRESLFTINLQNVKSLGEFSQKKIKIEKIQLFSKSNDFGISVHVLGVKELSKGLLKVQLQANQIIIKCSFMGL